MELSQANELLDSDTHAFEDGFKVLPSGVGFIAARTEMPNCKGEMVDWWFKNLRTSEEYKKWHPQDHVWCDWKGEDGNYIGGTHLIHERLGGEQVFKLKVNFLDPGEILDKSRFDDARVGAAVYARGGPIGAPFFVTRLLHLVQDTDNGCVMRSRFWLGQMPYIPVLRNLIRKDVASDAAMEGLHRHCKEEMSILANILPEAFARGSI